MRSVTKKILTAAVLLSAMAGAQAGIPTLVQFSTDGSGDGVTDGAAGGYDVTGIAEFDWQSSGDLVIKDDLTGSGSTANGVLTDSFATWAATAVDGDTITFDIEAHARLNDMLNSAGGSILPSNISTDGTATGCADGAGCIEITSALTATETATLSVVGSTRILVFTSISGSYSYFIDSSPDSVVETGAGFDNGTVFLSGSLLDVSGSFIQGSGGSNLISNDVDSYLSNYIQTDPASLQPLVDTTFDTLVSLVSSTDASATDAGDTIGLSPYTVLAADLGFKADANSEFSAAVPEPGSLLLLGAGMLGLSTMRRRRRG